MANIKVFALGGLGENGKNLYITEVDSKIFILDCGIKYPPSELFGIDTIIPDFTYLEENKERIIGVFLSHGHEDHIAGLIYLFKKINVPVYGSNFTISLLEDLFKEEKYNLNDFKLNRVSDKDILKFNDVKVSFYATTHSIPESLGIAIHTNDGCIVYTGDYTFDQNVELAYKTNFRNISNIANEGVLCLLGESVGADNFGNSASHFELMHRLNGIFSNAKGRIICSLFSSDLRRIQQIVNLSIRYNKKIAIIGRRTQRIVDIAVKLGYLKIPAENLVTLRYIDEKNKNDFSDLVVLVTGLRHEPFYMLQRMCRKVDRLINITENDTVVMLTSPIPGTEKMAARTLDILSRNNTLVNVIDKKVLQASHASSEEIKLLVNMLNPKYVIPVKGEYRQQYAQQRLIEELGFEKENIIILDNGNVLEFENGNRVPQISEVRCGEVLIDGAIDNDISDVVLKDRESLATDGVLMIIADINPKTKKVVSGPEIVSRGFVYMKDNEEIINEIKNIFESITKKVLSGKYINWSEYKNEIKSEVNKYLFKETRRNPITIPVVISVEN